MKKRDGWIVFWMLVAGQGVAELSLPSVFSDHMVLLRDHPVPVWGTADAGATVTVTFDGQKKSVVADSSNHWKTFLDPMPASSKPRKMTVSSTENSELQTLNFSDVLIGEVWLCSGQSNMHYGLNGLSKQYGAPTKIADEILAADYPLIRQMQVALSVAPEDPQEDVNGFWAVCSPETAGGFSGTAYFFARVLYRELNVPVGIIRSAWGGTPVQSWTRHGILMSNDTDRSYVMNKEAEARSFLPEEARAKVEAWGKENPGKKAPGWVVRMGKAPTETSHYPGTLYNAMIAPLIPYAIRGVIWYQGEANAQPAQSLSYHRTFSNMILDWRVQWGQVDFPFYFVQLANFKQPPFEPVDMDVWAQVRESQFKTLAVTNTGMAVTIDIGESEDIHPRNKIDVGRRLAYWALAKDYGRNLTCSGPLYESAKVDGRRMILTFRETGSGLMVGGKADVWASVQRSNDALTWFQVCGADRKWVWADAEICGSDTVVVSHPSVTLPVAVRYAWASNPEGCNLYNSAGLPASPFRTDTP